MSSFVNYYAVLDASLGPSSSSSSIRRFYRSRALAVHPDKNPDRPGAAEEFHSVQFAYEVLSDPVKRAAFDSQLQMQIEAEAQRKLQEEQSIAQRKKESDETRVFREKLERQEREEDEKRKKQIEQNNAKSKDEKRRKRDREEILQSNADVLHRLGLMVRSRSGVGQSAGEQYNPHAQTIGTAQYTKFQIMIPNGDNPILIQTEFISRLRSVCPIRDERWTRHGSSLALEVSVPEDSRARLADYLIAIPDCRYSNNDPSLLSRSDPQRLQRFFRLAEGDSLETLKSRVRKRIDKNIQMINQRSNTG
jgi:curved DNA-binding protein CbpA